MFIIALKKQVSMSDIKYLNIALSSDELHRKIGAGIPLGSIMLIEGEDGGGKSITCQRFLYGFLKNGHSATYICSEMTTKDFVKQMKSLEYDVSHYLIKRKLLYIPMFPRVGRVLPREDFLERLMRAQQLFQTEAVIIDTLNSLITEKFTKQDTFRFLTFLKKVANLDKTVIITANPHMIDKGFLDVLRGVADVHLKIDIKQAAGNIRRSLNVYRFRGSSIMVSPTIGFRVEPRIGFVIEISAVA